MGLHNYHPSGSGRDQQCTLPGEGKWSRFHSKPGLVQHSAPCQVEQEELARVLYPSQLRSGMNGLYSTGKINTKGKHSPLNSPSVN